MKQRVIKGILSVVLLAFLVSLPSQKMVSAAQEEVERTVVRVAFPQTKGLSETDSDGTRKGVFYDWLIEISKYTQWEYEFVEGDTESLIDMLNKGDIDLMGGMYYMPELEEIYSYPNYSIGYSNSLLLKRAEDDSIQKFDLSTLNGKTIGAYSKAVSTRARLEYFLTYNSLECKMKYYEDPSDMGTALDNGEIDLLMGGDAYITADRIVATRFSGEPYYIIARKDLPEVSDRLNDAITEIYMANPDFADEVYNRYFEDTYDNVISLTGEDQEYIDSAPSIRVAILNRYPLAYTGKEGNRGICKDMFEHVSEQTGLKFEYVYTETYQEMLDLVASGEADIAGSFMDEELAAEDKDMVLTKSYVELDEAVLKNKQVDYPSKNLKLAVPKGRTVPGDIDAAEILYYDTLTDCVDAVEKGEADVTVVLSAFVEDLLYSNYYSQVSIVAGNSDKIAMSVAVPRSKDVQLYSIVNKAINSFPSGEMDSIVSSNLLSSGENRITLKNMIYSNPVAFIVIIGVFLFLVALSVVLYGQFKMKNRVMQIQLEKANESSQAKSEFLSRMSHEIRTPMNAIIGLSQIALHSDNMPEKELQLVKDIQSSSRFLLSLVNDILDMSKIESSKMELTLAPFMPRTLMEETESMMRVQAEKQGIKLKFICELQHEQFIGDAIRVKQVVINLLSNALKFTKKGGEVTVSMKEIESNKTGAKLSLSVKDNGIGIDKKDMERIFRSFEQGIAVGKVGQGTGLGLAISSNLVRLMGGELSVKSEPGEGSEFFFSIWLPVSEEPETETAHGQEKVCDIAGMRILLAEDNDLNAKIVAYMLEAQGVRVERAEDGQIAIDMFKNKPEGYYDLILMDIQMPVKSGLAATQEIRSMERPDAKEIAIIAMTANTFKEDQETAMQSGMNAFLPKPFEVQQLYEIMESFMT